MQRLATGIFLGLAWLLLLLKGQHPGFLACPARGCRLLLHEFCRMTLDDFSRRDRTAVTILGLLPVAAAYLGTSTAIDSAALLAFLLLFLHIFSIYPHRPDAIRLLLRGIFAIVYLGIFSAHAMLIRRVRRRGRLAVVSHHRDHRL